MVVSLTKEEMQDVVSIEDIILANEEALKIYSEGGAVIPLRLNVNVEANNGQSLYMPGYAKNSEIEALGAKIVTVYPDNPKKYNVPAVPATMILQNPKTGEVSCIMDGTYLTQLRTGALSGLASKYLARKDSSVLLQVGVGGQAETQVDAVLSVRDIKKVYVSCRSLEKALEFSKFMEEKYKNKVEFIAVDDANKHVAEADIITLVTTSNEAVIDGELVKEGTHINSVGSYTPIMQETPVEVLKKSSKIYFDTYEGVIEESGDVIIPIKNGEFSKENITGEIGELLLGKKKARENDSEITWFKTTGSAVLDIVAGEVIYRKYKEKNNK
ncbi:ornithine cyclodeaminase [Peptostreptococcus russellii]|uniref:Ornithine cyclodeaminase n=1 Tax=Peptostreptococcus russellii TaxID=215200 RepID=A0A1H8IHU6_9FIRM|nr:ornithine cyclodeaminase family protein [Peptostreptococcus russellii]SEN67842.1 ornithine cyclodeaminase [Peptostreptococcus russellii]